MWKFWVSVVFSLIAIIVSGIALAVTLPSVKLGLDYVGVIIGLLSFLITLLVGWNIFSAIDIKRDFEKFKETQVCEINNLHKECNHLIDEREKAIYKTIGDELKKMKSLMDKSEALLQANIASSLAASLGSDKVETKYLFISHSIKAVVLWANCQEYANANANIYFLTNVLNPKDVFLRESQIKSINETLKIIKHRELIEQYDKLLVFVSELKTK